MADFTPDIAPPGNAWMIGRGAEAPDSLVGKLGGAVGNALDKGMDIFRTSKGNDLQASEGEELSSQLRDWASGQSDNILGQKTNPADSDPGLKAAKGEIDLHASAAAQGSPGSKQSLMTRLSEITSRYASQNPYYAPQLQEYAQKVLGFNANAQLLQVASEAEDFKKKLTQGAQEKLVNTAVDAGAGQYNADASLDIPTTMMHGQEILTEQNKATLALQQATLATAQAKPLMTKEQTDDSEFRTVLPVAVKIGDAATNGIWSKFAPMIGRAETGNPVDQPAIAAEVAMAQQNAILQVTKWMDTQNIGEKTRTDIINDTKRRFEPITAILGGDLSAGKQLTTALTRIKDTYGITFARVAPHVYSAIVIGGPQAAAAMVQNYTSPATTNPNYRQNQTEMSNYFSNPPTFDETMRRSNAFMGGTYSPAAEQDPQKAKAVLSTTLPVLDNFSERPHKLDDKEQRVLGNLVGGASAAALGADEPSILNAATRLTRPGIVQGMIKYAQNPANANDVAEKMSNYGKYLSRVQEVSGRLISQGADTSTYATADVIRAGHGVGAISIHYSATFGPMGATPTFTATDGRGKPMTLSEAQKASVLRGDPNFGRALSTFNAARKADETIRTELMKGQSAEPKAKTADVAPKPPMSIILAERLQDVFPGAKVTSGPRTEAQNKAAGGAKHSMHLRGQALDFDLPGYTKEQIRHGLEAAGLPVTELLDHSDEESLGVGHMGPTTFHWGWGSKA